MWLILIPRAFYWPNESHYNGLEMYKIQDVLLETNLPFPNLSCSQLFASLPFLLSLHLSPPRGKCHLPQIHWRSLAICFYSETKLEEVPSEAWWTLLGRRGKGIVRPCYGFSIFWWQCVCHSAQFSDHCMSLSPCLILLSELIPISY